MGSDDVSEAIAERFGPAPLSERVRQVIRDYCGDYAPFLAEGPDWSDEEYERFQARLESGRVAPALIARLGEVLASVLDRPANKLTAWPNGSAMAVWAEGSAFGHPVILSLFISKLMPVTTLCSPVWNHLGRLKRGRVNYWDSDACEVVIPLIRRLEPVFGSIASEHGYEFAPADCDAFTQKVNNDFAWDYLFDFGYPDE